MRSPSSGRTWTSSSAQSSFRSPAKRTVGAYLGYVLGRRSWRQGYATEAAARMLRHSFVELGLRSITATCDPDNAASAAVLRKIGMHQEGYLRHHVHTRGEWRDRLLFVAP